MQGPIENALMLVAAGNSYLQGRDIAGFWPDAPTFTFLKLCEFRLPPASAKDTDDHPLAAADPMEWFASLKPWSRGLRLHTVARKRARNQTTDAPERMLVGLVGGGPPWLIEAVGDPLSQLWEGFYRLGDRNDANRKIWLCTHIRQGEIAATDVEPVELASALVDLRAVLPEIEDFAREEQYDSFADCFARASKALDTGVALDAPWVAETLRFSGFDPEKLGVLQAINHAWVFGGMGSWNDLGGGEQYDALSDRLFNALNNAIAGLGNATFRG
jgi:hypothetical protein